MKIILMNSPVATVEGIYELIEVSADEVIEVIQSGSPEICSFIGHPGTAAVMETLLGIHIPVNRGMYKHEVGDIVFVFRLLQRMPEGAVLSAAEIEAIGYEFMRFNRIA